MILFSQRLVWGPMTKGVRAYVEAWCEYGVWSPSGWPDFGLALGYRWHSPRGPEYQMGPYDVFSLLNLKDEEEQLKCQVVLKYPRGRSGIYMQFKLEGRDVCASGQLKGKCPFSNLLQMEMSSQLDWPASPRDQVEGKRFGSGSRAAGGGGGRRVEAPALLPSLLPTTH